MQQVSPFPKSFLQRGLHHLAELLFHHGHFCQPTSTSCSALNENLTALAPHSRPTGRNGFVTIFVTHHPRKRPLSTGERGQVLGTYARCYTVTSLRVAAFNSPLAYLAAYSSQDICLILLALPAVQNC